VTEKAQYLESIVNANSNIGPPEFMEGGLPSHLSIFAGDSVEVALPRIRDPDFDDYRVEIILSEAASFITASKYLDIMVAAPTEADVSDKPYIVTIKITDFNILPKSSRYQILISVRSRGNQVDTRSIPSQAINLDTISFESLVRDQKKPDV
jgi:hypothetical protein